PPFPHLAGCTDRPVGSHRTDLDEWHRPTHRSWARRVILIEERHDRSGLGQSVAVEQRHSPVQVRADQRFRRETTTDPPVNKVGSTVTPRPPMRVNGAAARVTSAGPMPHSDTIWITSHSTFPCERITPFGGP